MEWAFHQHKNVLQPFEAEFSRHQNTCFLSKNFTLRLGLQILELLVKTQRPESFASFFLVFCSLKWSTQSVKLVPVQSAVCTGRPHWQVLPPGLKGWEGRDIVWIGRMRSKGLRRLKGLHCVSLSEHTTLRTPSMQRLIKIKVKRKIKTP